jgi:hypothetical protein
MGLSASENALNTAVKYRDAILESHLKELQ